MFVDVIPSSCTGRWGVVVVVVGGCDRSARGPSHRFHLQVPGVQPIASSCVRFLPLHTHTHKKKKHKKKREKGIWWWTSARPVFTMVKAGSEQAAPGRQRRTGDHVLGWVGGSS